MTSTTHLGLPYIDAAQSQKHVTHNLALQTLDTVVQLSVAARNILTPPATLPADPRYLIGTGATGAFAGYDGCIASYIDSAWTFATPQAGWRLFVEAESVFLIFDGTSWHDLSWLIKTLDNLTHCGIGTTADAVNLLSAKLNSALFAAKSTSEGGTGDLRFTLNKSSLSNTVSQLYQNNWSGRAETGLTGDDHFHIKVSPDGSNWHEAINIDPATGIVSFPAGSSGASAALTIGTVTALAAGATPTASITGSSGTYTLNLGIPAGATGATGAAGAAGATGATGPAPTLAIGTVTKLIAGATPTATITGSNGAYTLNLGIPTGTTGATGPAPTLAMGTVTGLSAGSAPTATISGSNGSYTLNLGIPAGMSGATGATGATGSTGPAGATGATGPAPTLAIGSVSTLSAGAAATATITGASGAYTLNLGIPQGASGSGSGTVTSVALSAGTTGLTVTGGPITSSGTLTIGGTLGVSNGGTGLSSLGSGVSTALGNATNAASGLVALDSNGKLPAVDGSKLTGISGGSTLAGFRNKLINGTFLINQRGVSGTVTLAAGAYGHDRWKAGASGCTYSFTTVNNITTLTITAGSLQQVIEGNNIDSASYILSWQGTAQGRVNGTSYGASGNIFTLTGGNNTTIEFGTGTLSRPQFEAGTASTAF